MAAGDSLPCLRILLRQIDVGRPALRLGGADQLVSFEDASGEPIESGAAPCLAGAQLISGPLRSLNPRMTVGEMLASRSSSHRSVAVRPARRVAELLGIVGLKAIMAALPPFSGGQPLVAIARVGVEPKLSSATSPCPPSPLDPRQIRSPRTAAAAVLAYSSSAMTWRVSTSSTRVAVIYLVGISLRAAWSIFAEPRHPYTCPFSRCRCCRRWRAGSGASCPDLAERPHPRPGAFAPLRPMPMTLQTPRPELVPVRARHGLHLWPYIVSSLPPPLGRWAGIFSKPAALFRAFDPGCRRSATCSSLDAIS